MELDIITIEYSVAAPAGRRSDREKPASFALLAKRGVPSRSCARAP